MVKINGELVPVEGMTVAEYLQKANYNSQRVAVERNGDIVPKETYETAVFMAGDMVEIVSFVGGG